MTKILTALGLMSGTSMDGIDVALIRSDGEMAVEAGPSASFAYPDDFRSSLSEANAIAAHLQSRQNLPDQLRNLEREITDRHASAIHDFCAGHAIPLSSLDVIGFHGQTVLHRPEIQLSIQLGDGKRLAQLTGADVVYDLRAADLAAGGQGAPLAPVYHRALAAAIEPRPIAFLNVGGVANVTWIGADDSMIAFDTGPGNALIDDWVRAKDARPRDEGGELAQSGRVDAAVLQNLLDNPYFAAKPPKSLDRDDFSTVAAASLSLADGAATLTAFTAASVVTAITHLPAEPELWVVCGGGRHNGAIMSELRGRLRARVAAAEEIGCDGDMIEAQAFAYMAIRSLRGLPLSYPGTTGVPKPQVGGLLAKVG